MASACNSSSKSGRVSLPEDLEGEPLDKQKIEVNKDGRMILVKAINIGFMEPRQFVHYKPLVSFNTAKSKGGVAEEEWLERISFMEEDLHWLLKLPHQRFWSQVVYDEDLQRCLESYLTSAPREYDLGNNLRKDLFSTLMTVHKLVFLVFLRMSTYKESKMNCLSRTGFGEIIYNYFIFDIPKMMDLCVLYGNRNEVLLKKMISNVFNAQPNYTEDLVAAAPNLLMVFDNVEVKLGLHSMSDEENRQPIKLGENRTPSISSMSLPSLLDVVYYITDASITLNSFLEIYQPACTVLFKYEITKRIASFYNRIFPAIESELKSRRRNQEGSLPIIEETRNKLGLAKTHLIRMFRNFITECCLQPILVSRCESSDGFNALESSHLEELMQILTEVVTEKHFIQDYNLLYPLDADVEMLSEAEISLDPTRLDYIFNSIYQNADDIDGKNYSFPKNGGVHNELKSKRVNNLQDVATVFAEMNSTVACNNFSSAGATAFAPTVNDLQMESLIQAVLDVLPDYGSGFIEACLKYYEFSSEKVIDALLQENLPPSLSALDRFIEKKTVTNDAVAVGDDVPISLLSERRNIFDNDEFDIFNRVDVNMANIHVGKRDKTPQVYEGLKSTNDVDKSYLKEASLNYSVTEDIYYGDPGLYDDEYDDTYDSVMVSLEERQTEKELQSLRPFTIPRVLEQGKKKEYEIEIPNDDEEEIQQDSSSTRDEFVPNPEVLRKLTEQRRLNKTAARGGRRNHPQNSTDAPAGNEKKSTQTRQQNERHKGRVANHNRRHQSDIKKSRGMVPFPSR